MYFIGDSFDSANTSKGIRTARISNKSTFDAAEALWPNSRRRLVLLGELSYASVWITRLCAEFLSGCTVFRSGRHGRRQQIYTARNDCHELQIRRFRVPDWRI